MRMVWLIGVILFAAPACAEFGFDEKYERDHTIFNPLNLYRPDNPLDPINRYNLALRMGRLKQTAGWRIKD